MNEKNKQHAPAAALTGVQIGAPLNPHGQCFGLIPAGGDWLDDLIDWSRRQFKRPEDAQRLAASWNKLAYVPLDDLLQLRPQHPDDKAVDDFAAAMKTAMWAARAKGKGGWDDRELCSEQHLQELLRGARAKGDPVDVGNYAMMLFNRGERTALLGAAGLHAAIENYRAFRAVDGFSEAVACLTAAFDALEATADSDLGHFETEAEEAEGAPEQFAARKIARALELLYLPQQEKPPVGGFRTTTARMSPAAKACEHDWPAGEGGTDLNGTCTKCGMAFQYMIHMEMP